MPIGFSLAVIATTIVASIALSLAFPRAPMMFERATITHMMRATVGLVFAALGCTCLALVAGLPPPFLVRALEPVHTDWLLISGLCYAVCGWIRFT